MANEQREYLDITLFVEGHDGKKRPLRIGYAYKSDKGGLSFKLECLPVPGARTDYSGTIQRRQTRDEGASNGGGQRPQAQSHGAGGGDMDDTPFGPLGNI